MNPNRSSIFITSLFSFGTVGVEVYFGSLDSMRLDPLDGEWVRMSLDGEVELVGDQEGSIRRRGLGLLTGR